MEEKEKSNQILQKIQKKAEEQKILEFKQEGNQFIIEFIKVPILRIKFNDNDDICELTIKSVQGLNENISYLILDLIEEFPEMDSEEFKTLPKRLKGIQYAMNVAGLILNNSSLTGQNILLTKTQNLETLLLDNMNEIIVMNKTQEKTVYSITPKTKYQDNILANSIMTIELINELLNKGLEFKLLDNSFEDFIKNLSLLQQKIYKEIQRKGLKKMAKILTIIAVILTIIVIGLKYI